jgi:hypothetical protein
MDRGAVVEHCAVIIDTGLASRRIGSAISFG